MGEPSVERLHREPGAAQRELRDKDAELYVERTAPLALGHVQALPVPGSVELGPEELELHPADGHTPDGMAVMARWCGVLCAGDYLSSVEIPMVRPAGARRLPRHARPAGTARGGGGTVVPGPRLAPTTGRRALRILDEDVDYLDALERGEERPDAAEGPRLGRAARDPRAQPGAFALVRPGHR